MHGVQMRAHRRFGLFGIACCDGLGDRMMLVIALSKPIRAGRGAALHAYTRIGSHLAQQIGRASCRERV